jgi:RNA polymerase sigma-70 factor (ECF subfamily)
MLFVRTAATANDNYWVEQYRQGNRQAMGELYQRYFRKVYHRCLSLCKDPDQAFDLAQDALLKAFDHLSTFQGNSSFSTWLYTITFNHYREVYRKAKRLLMYPLQADNPGDALDLPASVAESGELETNQATMLALLNQLTDTEKTLLFLKYRDGESIEHLQAQFHLSEGAIKMRLKRARVKLNELYLRAVA